MDTNTHMATTDGIQLFEYWKHIPLQDIDPLKLNQKIEDSIDSMKALLEEIDDSIDSRRNTILAFKWSLSVRDFALVQRDALLAATKFGQLRIDEKIDKENPYLNEVAISIQNAAKELEDEYINSGMSNEEITLWEHQESPIREVINHLDEIQKQSKKIFRSNAKVDDIRTNINDFVKDFQLQFTRQTGAVTKVFSIVEELKGIVKSISHDSTEAKINKVVDQISDKSQQLELILDTESIEILSYANKETLSIPVSSEKGLLNFKSINVKSEFARWFSSIILPKVFEIESKRDQAIEKCLNVFSQIRTKVAAISLTETDESFNQQLEFDSIFLKLEKEVLEGLKKEEEEASVLILNQQKNHLFASNIYSNDTLFLPESGASQISNISRDAQKRIVENFKKYRNQVNNYITKVLSRYVEIEKTPYSQFVKNKLTIYDKDDALALFVKKGYLGKSFTIPRTDIIDSFLSDYNLWLDGFAGAVLLSGVTGSGKSTVLGMLNHLGLNEEIIQLKIGEFYFIEHRPYEPKPDFKQLLDQIIKQTKGRNIIICIDDLELWHDEENELFDNINRLINAITKYRKKIFFVVSCSPFLKDRISVFKELDTVFSSQIKTRSMNSNQIKTALNLRAKVNEKEHLNDSELEPMFGNVIRESKGNIGYAMMEYCRFHSDSYKSNVKSEAFKELIQSYHSLLIYISSYHQCSINELSNTLSEHDFRNTIRSIDHLVGQKVLIRPKKGYISINPLLVYDIERVLLLKMMK